MIALLRLLVIGFVVLTVFYVLIGIYARSLRRERLEDMWEDEGRPGERLDYVEKGMAAYNASLRPKLLIFVYVIPAIIVGVIIYVTNYT
jgi:hypothetical protein